MRVDSRHLTLVELVYLLASAAFAMPFAGRDYLSAWMIVLAVGAPTVIAAGLAVLITKLRGNGPRTDLRLHGSWRDVGLGLLFGFGGLFITIPAAVVYIRILGPHANFALGKIFAGTRASGPWAVAIFVLIVFAAPVCEEIVYRGLVWGAVERRWGRWVVLVVTTVVFALAHLEPNRTPLLLVVAVPIGLARLYSCSLLASIVAHQVTNLLPAISVTLGLVGVLHTF